MSIRVLKFVVIGLAVAIVVALAVVILGIVRLAPQAATSGGAISTPALDIKLQQPTGSELVSASVANGEVVAVVRGGGLPDRIVIADRASGRIKQTIWIADPP